MQELYRAYVMSAVSKATAPCNPPPSIPEREEKKRLREFERVATRIIVLDERDLILLDRVDKKRDEYWGKVSWGRCVAFTL